MTLLAAARRLRFMWTAHRLRALAETWLLGLLILFPLSQVIGDLLSPVFSNGILAVCGGCGLWVALRTRLPQTNPPAQLLWELLVGVALSLLMAVGLRLSTGLLGWSEVWHQSSLGHVATLLLLMTGPGYLLMRIVMRLWVLCNHLRRRRKLFSLTHAPSHVGHPGAGGAHRVRRVGHDDVGGLEFWRAGERQFDSGVYRPPLPNGDARNRHLRRFDGRHGDCDVAAIGRCVLSDRPPDDTAVGEAGQSGAGDAAGELQRGGRGDRRG